MAKVLGDWTVEKCIGEGAFGKVYKITKEDFGNVYDAALKVIEIPQNQSEVEAIRNEVITDESVTQYFDSMVKDVVAEFALMSKLKGNSNIVSYEDHSVMRKRDKFGWTIFIRMELLTPLYDYMKQHTLTVRDVIQIGIDMCSALEVCQKYNIIHRDIKPENIFISDVGTYKLGDFGIARQLEKTSSGLSKKGTKTYMAPEVYKGLEYNSTVDLYSLGIVLYRFLNNNRSPFMPPAPAPIRYSDKEKADILRMSGQSLPKPCNADGRLAEIILKACAYNPKERYESAYEMRHALQSVLYSENEGHMIYPDGDDLKNDNSGYVTGTNGSSNTVNDTDDEEDEFNSTVYLFNKPPVVMPEESNANIGAGGATGSTVTEQSQNNNNEKIAAANEYNANENSRYINNENQNKGFINTENTSKKIANKEIINNQNNDIRNSKKEKNKTAGIIAIAGIAAVIIGIVIIVALNNSGDKTSDDGTNSAGIEVATMSPDSDKDKESTKQPDATPVITVPNEVEIPKLKGLTVAEAKELTDENNLVMDSEYVYSDTVKKGHVIKQEPEAGSQAIEGTDVVITVSNGAEKMTVPDMENMKEDRAKTKLKNNHLKYKITRKYSDYVSKGRIISQGIKAGKKVKKNTVIKLVISKGAKPVQNTPTPSYSTGGSGYSSSGGSSSGSSGGSSSSSSGGSSSSSSGSSGGSSSSSGKSGSGSKKPSSGGGSKKPSGGDKPSDNEWVIDW